MRDDDSDRTASLMTPAKLAQLRMKPKPAGTPGGLLDQMAADAGAGHVRKLIDLRKQLETQARERNCDALMRTAQALADQQGTLDFALLQPKGWLARATGKGKEEGAGFATQFERIERAVDDFRDEYRALVKKHQGQTAVTDKTLVDFEVEARAIESIIDQGARWLQDMRSQLKTRHFSGPDAAAQKQIDEDTARCEVLVGRLKQLGVARSAAQHVQERIHNIAGKRAGLLEAVQRTLDNEVKAWLDALKPVATEALESGAVTQGLDRAKDAHQQLQLALKQATRDSGQLQFYDKDLVDELARLEADFQAAA